MLHYSCSVNSLTCVDNVHSTYAKCQNDEKEYISWFCLIVLVFRKSYFFHSQRWLVCLVYVNAM